MTEAFIYDHVRSPRGRGKQGGSLNPITPINLTPRCLCRCAIATNWILRSWMT